MERITEKLAQFIENTRYEDIPKEVLAVQKLSVLDACGITMGAVKG